MGDLVAGTYGNKIHVTVLDSTGGRYDLTDKTLWMLYRIERPKKSGRLTPGAKPMVVLGTGTSGEGEYTFVDGDLIGGEMTLEFEVRTSDSVRRSAAQQLLTVRTSVIPV